MTVTEEFWYGNLNPQENPASGSEFLRNARRQANGCYEKMKAKLTKEQMEEVENYIETQGGRSTRKTSRTRLCTDFKSVSVLPPKRSPQI